MELNSAVQLDDRDLYSQRCIQSVIDPNHNITTHQYDSQDRVTTVINPDGTTFKYTYNNQGNVTSITDERGNTTTYSYDALNRETGMTDPLNDITTYTYDSGGNLIKVQAVVGLQVGISVRCNASPGFFQRLVNVRSNSAGTLDLMSPLGPVVVQGWH